MINQLKRHLDIIRGIDVVIIMVSLFSFIAIISIGLDINWLQFDSKMDLEKINRINSVYLNLSYSYISGVIVYFFTVICPYYEKNKLYAVYFFHIVSKHKRNAIDIYLSAYLTDEKFDKEKYSLINDYFFKKDRESQKNTKCINKYYDEELLSEDLREIIQSKRNLTTDLSSKSEYFSRKVLALFFKFAEDDWEKELENYLGLLNVKAIKENILYPGIHDSLISYIDRLDELENTFKKYTLKK